MCYLCRKLEIWELCVRLDSHRVSRNIIGIYVFALYDPSVSSNDRGRTVIQPLKQRLKQPIKQPLTHIVCYTASYSLESQTAC